MKSSPRFWTIGGVVVVLIVALLGYMFAVRPVFQNVAAVRAEIQQTQEQTDRVIAQTRQLAQQEKDLQEQIRALERIRAKIPKDVNVPKLMRTIQAEARAEGVELDSLQPGQITLFEVVEPSPSPTSTDGQNQEQPAAAAPAPAPSSSNLGQGVAPKNIGVAYVPLSLTGEGTYGAVRRLTQRLEQQQRAFLITTLDINRQSDGDTDLPLVFTMQARVFVLNGDTLNLPASVKGG
jgi:hypothetical protein